MTTPSRTESCAKAPEAASAVKANEATEEERVSGASLAMVVCLIRSPEQFAERLDSIGNSYQITVYGLEDNLDHLAVQAHSLANKHKTRVLQ